METAEKKMTKIEEQYRILPPENDTDNVPVMIMRHDTFDGIVYRYGRVKIDEIKDGAYLNFTYDIVDNPDEIDTTSEEFKNFIGDVLVNMVEQNMKESQQDGDGSSNTIEPSQE